MEYRIVKRNGKYYAQAFTTSLECRFSWKKKWRDLGRWGIIYFGLISEAVYHIVSFDSEQGCREWLKKYINEEKEPEEQIINLI